MVADKPKQLKLSRLPQRYVLGKKLPKAEEDLFMIPELGSHREFITKKIEESRETKATEREGWPRPLNKISPYSGMKYANAVIGRIKAVKR